MKASGLLSAICLAAATAANPARAEWSLDAQAGLWHDSNPGNARAASDVGSDNVATATLAATYADYLDSGDRWSGGGAVATETYGRYTGLSRVSLGGFAALEHKIGLGPYAPWLRAGWSSSRLNYANAVRNGWLHQADFGAGKRFDERWSASLNYKREWRTATTQPEAEPGISGDAFSGNSHSLTLQAEYAAGAGVMLSASGFARRGDVVSISVDDDHVLDASKAAADDNVFGATRYAYRLLGTTFGLGAGLGVALGPRTYLNLGLQRQVTHGAGSNNYAKSIGSVTWIGSF